MVVTAPARSRWLLRLAARRPHVLVVPVPGAVAVRCAVEAELARRRWPVALSPADADVLLVAGEAGPRLSSVVVSVWSTVPEPRVRATVVSPGEVASVLDAAASSLARGDVSDAPLLAFDVSSSASSRDDRSPAENVELLTSSDSSGASLSPPVMADLAEDDRDGLAFDALHVPLGPVLPHWPAGLVIHAVLAGDVITDACAEVLDRPADHTPDPAVLDPDRRRLDALTRVLPLAGADAAARRARALRDTDPGPGVLSTFGRRLARSRLLARALRGIPLPGPEPTVEERVRALAAGLGGSLAAPARPSPDDAARALVGLELGAARLALAALDPDPTAGAQGRAGEGTAPRAPAGARSGHHHG